MKEKISIFLADDHQIVIDGLKLLLENEKQIVLIGSANNGQEAYDQILDLKPDIALIDLRMPDKNGLQIIQGLGGKIPTKFIILSMHNERRYIRDAMSYGASGYLLKNTGKEELLASIQKVWEGEKCFSSLTSGNPDPKGTFLTPRELEVFRLVISEHTSQQIAEKLSLSQYTVETHRKSIYKKTQVKNLIGLAKYALDNNISVS